MRVHFSVMLVTYGQAKISETVELPDDYTDDQIQEEYLNWQAEQLDGGWSRLEGKEE